MFGWWCGAFLFGWGGVKEIEKKTLNTKQVRGNSTHSPMMVELARLLPQYPYAVYQPGIFFSFFFDKTILIFFFFSLT